MALNHFDLSFYRGKRVLITGHTGFKGTWLTRILSTAGAALMGYALEPPTVPSFFALCRREIDSRIGDIRDFDGLFSCMREARPEIVFHLAAQPIVREGYRRPMSTYATNVMGTVHLLECVRRIGGVKSVVNVTTDKVYENRAPQGGFCEDNPLGGFDPYSSSKACSELVTQCYRDAFLADEKTAVSTVRAGNAIGGGDFAADRILPDCLRAAQKGEPIKIRNPEAVRPYQHVLEALFFYLTVAAAQAGDSRYAGSYNVGPDEEDCVSNRQLADLFCKAWGDGLSWSAVGAPGPREAEYLRLDCSKAKRAFGWRPIWSVKTAVQKTVAWDKCFLGGGDVTGMMERQIADYQKELVNR